MKRSILFLSFILLGCSILFAQSTSLSPTVNIKGVFRKEYQGISKGTPFVLQRVVKLKNASEQGVSRTQAVLIVNGVQLGLPMNMFDVVRLQPDDKNSFWQSRQLSNELITYYEKKGYQESLRKEQAQEANDYLRELEQSKLFYEDAAVEDYLQCLLLSIIPEQMAVKREGVPQIRVLKSPSPDMLMLANNCLLISTGMLTTLDTEEELYAILSREVAHYVLDHGMITVNKNIARARRAEFWGAVMDGVVAATEEYLTERYDYYVPGLIYVTNDVVQALVNDDIMNRMGLDYSAQQEREADRVAMAFMDIMGKNKEALVSALTKINTYYERQRDAVALSKYGIYGSLSKRLEKLGEAPVLEEDRNYLKKNSGVVSFEAAMLDYNKDYKESRRLAMKNIDNGMACSDDYLMVARSIMKLSNTPEANKECMSYLDKADEVAKVTNLNICKMRILLLLRENKQMDAVDLLHQYQSLLDAMFQQPHSEEDAQWIAAEHTWAEKLLDRTYIM
jgi:Zn-dependent protease with chaperone function